MPIGATRLANDTDVARLARLEHAGHACEPSLHVDMPHWHVGGCCATPVIGWGTRMREGGRYGS